MAIPSIEPSEVGLTGLLWLLLSYGYLLYSASNLISEGSELLLLVPSMAGLVGGVVLPVLGAVPDGAIILFSGLGGDLDAAQETLSVGVGTLAGSTIMLLTIPWAGSVYAGRVDILPNGLLNYRGKPKLDQANTDPWTKTGVALTQAVQHGGVIMMLTTIPYFLIQIPAQFLSETATTSEEVAYGERYWALAGLIVCLMGLIVYMTLQLRISQQGQDKMKRMAVLKKMLKQGAMSLSGAVSANLKPLEEAAAESSGVAAGGEYQSLVSSKHFTPAPEVKEYLKEVLADAFYSYDRDGNGLLDRAEVYVFFRDFHESISEKECYELFDSYDTDRSGSISFDEFIGLAYTLIKAQELKAKEKEAMTSTFRSTDVMAQTALSQGDDDEGPEEESMPEEFTNLSPAQQQTAIKQRAFVMLAIGTALVVIFSDPMVDVLQEVAVRAHVSPFYVSFILAPLASNASEFIASIYYSRKKTRKTMTVALTALEGAACMNNTFCLSIFMGLIYFRGLAWQYTAETVAIITVEFIIGFLVRRKTMTALTGLFILSLFPISLVIVFTLESLGFD